MKTRYLLVTHLISPRIAIDYLTPRFTKWDAMGILGLTGALSGVICKASLLPWYPGISLFWCLLLGVLGMGLNGVLLGAFLQFSSRLVFKSPLPFWESMVYVCMSFPVVIYSLLISWMLAVNMPHQPIIAILIYSNIIQLGMIFQLGYLFCYLRHRTKASGWAIVGALTLASLFSFIAIIAQVILGIVLVLMGDPSLKERIFHIINRLSTQEGGASAALNKIFLDN